MTLTTTQYNDKGKGRAVIDISDSEDEVQIIPKGAFVHPHRPSAVSNTANQRVASTSKCIDLTMSSDEEDDEAQNRAQALALEVARKLREAEQDAFFASDWSDEDEVVVVLSRSTGTGILELDNAFAQAAVDKVTKVEAFAIDHFPSKDSIPALHPPSSQPPLIARSPLGELPLKLNEETSEIIPPETSKRLNEDVEMDDIERPAKRSRSAFVSPPPDSLTPLPFSPIVDAPMHDILSPLLNTDNRTTYSRSASPYSLNGPPFNAVESHLNQSSSSEAAFELDKIEEEISAMSQERQAQIIRDEGVAVPPDFPSHDRLRLLYPTDCPLIRPRPNWHPPWQPAALAHPSAKLSTTTPLRRFESPISSTPSLDPSSSPSDASLSPPPIPRSPSIRRALPQKGGGLLLGSPSHHRSQPHPHPHATTTTSSSTSKWLIFGAQAADPHYACDDTREHGEAKVFVSSAHPRNFVCPVPLPGDLATRWNSTTMTVREGFGLKELEAEGVMVNPWSIVDQRKKEEEGLTLVKGKEERVGWRWEEGDLDAPKEKDYHASGGFHALARSIEAKFPSTTKETKKIRRAQR